MQHFGYLEDGHGDPINRAMESANLNIENVPLFHFDPLRGELTITRDIIKNWCRSSIYRPEGAGTSSCSAYVARKLAEGEDAGEVHQRVRDFIIHSIDQVSDFIWDLAREFSYDPIEHDPTTMWEILDYHIAFAIGEDIDPQSGEKAKSDLRLYKDLIRDTVEAIALNSVMDRAIEDKNAESADLFMEHLTDMVKRYAGVERFKTLFPDHGRN